jgi:hypothetical protein
VGSVLSEQEDSLDGLASTFASIQPPPGAESEAVRTGVEDLLDAALAPVGDLRIAARREDTAPYEALLVDLDTAADDLRAFLEEHR